MRYKFLVCFLSKYTDKICVKRKKLIVYLSGYGLDVEVDSFDLRNAHLRDTIGKS